MTNNEPEFETPAAAPVQSCFFYDQAAKKIHFSSSSPDSFFGVPLDLQQDPPFLGAFKGDDAHLLSNEWSLCLGLKDNEVKEFSITTGTPGNRETFKFTVMRPVMPGLIDSSLLVITVVRMPEQVTPVTETQAAVSRNQAYTEFIELAAHDLDGPLRKLSMLLERIASKYDSNTEQDTHGYFLRARASLAEMRLLIENLTLLARLSVTSNVSDSATLESIIQTAIKDLPGLAGENSIRINVDPLAVVKGDLGQYRQLFSSLLGNAVKFRKKETAPEPDIFSQAVSDKEKKLHSLPLENPYIRITIADKGIGFRQEYAEKIFQPFVRLNGKSEYPGSGIGLALSKKIVENHGGIIYAEGEENLGATFTVFLPLSPY